MSDAVVIPQQSSGAIVGGIGDASGFYSSLRTNSRAEKMKFLALIGNAQRLTDHTGKQIPVVDLVLQTVEIANERTGEVESGIRATLVDVDGNAYFATSKGLVQSLKQALSPSMFGTPDTWTEPLVIVANEERGRNGYKYLTLQFVEAEDVKS